MNVREATAADEATLLAFTQAIFDENWDRPWPHREVAPALFEGKLVLLAEDDGEPIGYALGAFGERAREAGIEHLTLDVATSNDVGREVWRRLGFTEWAQRLTVPIARLAQQPAHAESYASLPVLSRDPGAAPAG